MLALGNLFGKTGWAEWFPSSIVPLLIGMVADPVGSLPPGSYMVLAGTFMARTAATILQLRLATTPNKAWARAAVVIADPSAP